MYPTPCALHSYRAATHVAPRRFRIHRFLTPSRSRARWSTTSTLSRIRSSSPSKTYLIESAEYSGNRSGAPNRSRRPPSSSTDAFTEPRRVRFALKATSATMATYIIYQQDSIGPASAGMHCHVFLCRAQHHRRDDARVDATRSRRARHRELLGALCIVYVLPASDGHR